MNDWVAICMINAYVTYLIVVYKFPKNKDKILEYSKWFYDECYSEIDGIYEEEKIQQHVFNNILSEYNKGMMHGVVQEIGFNEFLKLLKD